MGTLNTKLVVFLLAFSAIGCGGGGGGGLEGVRSHNDNPFNGNWRSTITITRDTCNWAQYFPSFAPHQNYSIWGDTFDVDVYDRDGQHYSGEIMETTGLGASTQIGVLCGKVNAGVFPKILRMQLVSENEATIDMSISFTCPGQPTCNINATGLMQYLGG